MKVNWIFVGIVIVGAALGFTLNPNGPIGSKIWPLPAGSTAPEGGVLAAFMAYSIFEALAFGLGIAFLVYGFKWTRRVAHAGRTYASFVVLCVSWFLLNWVPHTALHMSMGHPDTQSKLAQLAGIEFGFHFTMMLAGAFLATFVYRVISAQIATTGTPTPPGRATPATTKT